MQTLKIIGAAVFALFAVGSLFSLLGGSAPGGAFGTGQMAGRVLLILLFAALAVALWRSGNRRNPPRV